MPTFDFIGYSDAEVEVLLSALIPLLRQLPFADDIVFIQRPSGEQTRVIDLNGSEQPFIRVSTRMRERADILSRLISPYSDVETTEIWHFQQRGTVES
jgi:hypothetical protein